MKQVHTAIKPNAAPGFMYMPILIYTLSFKRLQHSSIVYRYLRAEVCVCIYIYIHIYIHNSNNIKENHLNKSSSGNNNNNSKDSNITKLSILVNNSQHKDSNSILIPTTIKMRVVVLIIIINIIDILQTPYTMTPKGS